VKENINECDTKLNIYSKNTTKEILLNERDRLINDILDYRNISIVLNEEFNDLIESNIQKKNGFFCNLLRCLKN
jgi:hypothetical protein